MKKTIYKNSMKARVIKYSYSLVVLALLFVQCADKKEKIAEAKPVQIPGTQVSLVPGPGFVLDPGMGGFTHTSLTATVFTLEAPKSYDSIVAEIDKEKMKTQGTTLLRMDTVSVSGLTGRLYKSSRDKDDAPYFQWVLVLPLQGHALTVTGTFLPDDDLTLSPLIKEMLMSTHVVENTSGEAGLNFSIEADSLKFAKILEGPSVMFTQTGEWNESSIFDLSFFAGPSHPNPPMERSKEFVLSQLKQVCADCEVIKNGIQPITIDSLSGYEVVALSKDSTGFVKRLKYEVMLFDSTRYYLLVGTSTKNSTDRIEMFKNISRTFKKKRSVEVL